jgi:hypothetical protein
MKITMRLRFWFEAGMATISSILLVITLLWEDWIEIVFGISPDGGDGSLERWLVGTLLVVTIMLFVMARNEWRRARTTVLTA